MNKIIWALLIFILGTGFGIYWRTQQTESTLNQEIQIVRDLNREARRSIAQLEARLMVIEAIQKNRGKK